MRVHLLAAMALGTSIASTHAQPLNGPLLWASSEASLPGIQADVTNLHLTLYQLQKAGVGLRTRKAMLKDESGTSIKQLVARERLYVGSGENFPWALDALICELNPNKCDVALRRPGELRGRWFRVRNEEILIPDMALESEELIRVYVKKKGDRLSSIVVKDRAGCESYDAKCDAKLKHLNVEEKLRDEAEGPILVPSASYSARLPLAPGTAEKIAKGGIVKLGVDRSTAKRFLGNVIVTPAAVKANQSDANSRAPDLTKQKLLALIKYRRVESAGFGKRLAISLVDSRPDLNHCEFDFKQLFKEKNQLIQLDAEPVAAAAAATPNSPAIGDKCGEQSKLEVQTSEHGTHLLGLWFSKRDAKTGEGMLPYENTFLGVGTVDYSKMTQAPYYNKVGSLIHSLATQYNVINLSWGVPATVPLSGGTDNSLLPRKDPVADAIMVTAETGLSNVLFVAAAGNDGRRLDDGACDITPVCGPKKRTHVLTVAALTNDDDNPDLGSRTNFGRPVDIGVPAVNLWSTIRENRAARGSGSSQAAATAAAAASMLMYATDMKPQVARNRMIYTSDLTPKLQENGGKLFGGRLNFAQALDVRVAKAVFGKEEVKGTVQFSLKDKPSSKVPNLTVRTPEGAALDIPMDAVKRLHRNGPADPSRPFTVFYVDRATAQLARLDGALAPDALAINVNVARPGEALVSRKLKDLDDYIAMGPQIRE